MLIIEHSRVLVSQTLDHIPLDNTIGMVGYITDFHLIFYVFFVCLRVLCKTCCFFSFQKPCKTCFAL